MGTDAVLDFTISDLLQGGDDVVPLVAAAEEPDGVWDEIGRWPRRRLTAALVTAIGVIQGGEPDEVADGRGRPRSDWPVTAATAAVARSDGR